MPLQSAAAYLRLAPRNIKCLFEGEEEIGSTNLPDFVRRHSKTLKADVAALSDTRCWR